MKWRYIVILLLVLAIGACQAVTPTQTPAGEETQTPTGPAATELPQVIVNVTSVPDAQEAAETFLSNWQKEDYAAMHAALSTEGQVAVSAEALAQYYQDLATNLTLKTLTYEIISGETGTQTAAFHFSIQYQTSLFGEMTRENDLALALQDGNWRVQWNDGLGMPDLRGGNRLSLELQPGERGEILDRDGYILAGNMEAVALGIVPGKINADQEGLLLDTLFDLTGRVPASIKASYENAGADWYIVAGEASQEALDERSGVVNSLSGLQYWPYGKARFYPWGGVSPHVLGYAQQIPAEELEKYLRQGYRRDELVGTRGLERWGQDILAGTRAANLYVVNSSGQGIDRLAQVEAQDGSTIVTTLDIWLQRQAQIAMREFRGAAVVMERDTGRVLAMVSSPGFDPNLFNGENYNTQMGGLQTLLESQATPLVNRAAQGSGYPLGSVFKIIDMAAALESGAFTAESEYDCQYEFNEIVGRTYYDWTLKKEYPPSGLLTLPEGLMRSCNPWFYHIGLELYKQGKTTAIADMARGFGLGAATGIEQVAEIEGQVPDPASEVEAVEQAIGQGELQVTPLQVADFIAAVGNGGTLYRPQVVEKIVAADGTETQVFKPEERGKLPVKPENLEIIQDAMRSVTANSRGTAIDVFRGFSIPVFGKTGTAQNGTSEDHAWFAAYTDVPDGSKPDIAVAVICEYAGEGSEYAAPIVRRILEIYYYGKAIKLYPWEESINVTATETPTPTPGEEATETPAP